MVEAAAQHVPAGETFQDIAVGYGVELIVAVGSGQQS